MENNKKFTLIEMIVVIAIFGILLSILLPSLGKARAKGKSVVCLSNISQHMQALVLYSKENESKFPKRVQENVNGGESNWALCSGIDEGSSAAYFPTEKRQLNKFLNVDSNSEPGLNLCPSKRGQWLYDIVGTSYQYNTFYGPDYSSNNSAYITIAVPGKTTFVTQINSPSLFVGFSEIDAYGRVIDGITKSPHLSDKQFNLGFVDGHAARTSIEHRIMNNGNYSYIHESSSSFAD